MVKRSKKLNTVQKFVIFGLVLCAALLAFILLNRSTQSSSLREKITNVVQKQALPPRRKEQMKIQLALNDFRVKNHGKLPQNLNELIPTYFDVVPVDPDTGKAFSYRVENNRFFVGETDEEREAQKNPKKRKKDSLTVGSEPATEAEQDALIAAISDQQEQLAFVYDPIDKRDPFRPYNMVPELDEDDKNKTDLEKLAIGQLRLTATLDGLDNPKAIVESSTGRGFTLEKGTKIGTNGGEVIDILPDKILILETSYDFTGEKKTKTIEMRLRTGNKQ